MHLIRNTVGLLALVSVTNLSAFAQCPEGDCINRREPGSLLLFPEYQNGPGRVTVATVTNANCDAAGTVTVEFKYHKGDDCSEANEAELLTPCDTVTFFTSTHTGVGEGYFYAFARTSGGDPAGPNPAGDPIVFNHLVGTQLVVNAWTSVDYSVNAVSFKGVGREGTVTDREVPGLFRQSPGDGIRDLDGNEYEPAPEKILIPRFFGQDEVLKGGGLHSDLILIALSGGVRFAKSDISPGAGTTILVHVWNDNEFMTSLEHTFSCWQKIRLGLLQSPNPDDPFPSPGTNAFDQDVLDDFNSDPNEINGIDREAGWIWINGVTASSSAESIFDPAFYAVLVENIRGHSAADLPFELCSQTNGDLLPNSLFGDFPFLNGDNQ